MYEHIVILTGAGISAESGIATFRSQDGLWCSHRIEEVATPEAFAQNPQLVQQFYNNRRRQLQEEEVKPNKAHEALARLEKEHHGTVTLITQNIDNLHERAGSQNIIHMHGELLKARCTQCGRISIWREDIREESICPACGTERSLRPHIVWFGEMPLSMDKIEYVLLRCDLFLSIGTSGQVYPAAGFVERAQQGTPATTMEINLEKTALSEIFQETYFGKAGELVPQWVEKILHDH